MSINHPWHEKNWQTIAKYLEQGRLPQALILVGNAGMGKNDFSYQLAQLLLCQRPHTTACGECESCYLFASGNHPDLIDIIPEKVGGHISVERIRKINEVLSHSAFAEQYRVIRISPAHALNEHAQNALLKNIEEPPNKTIFILVADTLASLKMTLQSRCQTMIFPAVFDCPKTLATLATEFPGIDLVQALYLADGAPLAVKQWLKEEEQQQWSDFLTSLAALNDGKKSLISVAKDLNAIDYTKLIAWFIRVCEDAQYCSFGVMDNGLRQSELMSVLQSCMNLPSRVFELRDFLLDLKQKERHNLNTQLALESILTRWLECRVDGVTS